MRDRKTKAAAQKPKQPPAERTTLNAAVAEFDIGLSLLPAVGDEPPQPAWGIGVVFDLGAGQRVSLAIQGMNNRGLPKFLRGLMLAVGTAQASRINGLPCRVDVVPDEKGQPRVVAIRQFIGDGMLDVVAEAEKFEADEKLLKEVADKVEIEYVPDPVTRRSKAGGGK